MTTPKKGSEVERLAYKILLAGSDPEEIRALLRAAERMRKYHIGQYTKPGECFQCDASRAYDRAKARILGDE